MDTAVILKPTQRISLTSPKHKWPVSTLEIILNTLRTEGKVYVEIPEDFEFTPTLSEILFS